MRICYLINGLNGGGAALPIPDLAAVMARAGHEVSIVALARQDGQSIARLQAAGLDCRVIGPESLGLRAFVRLIRHLRRERPDLLWTSLTRATLFGQLAGRLLGIPVVSWQHNAFLKRGNIFLLRLTRSLTRLWVADSESVRRFALRTLKLPAQNTHIWPLFVADPGAPQCRPRAYDEPFRVGSLGRLHANKQYEVLIRAAARITELDPAASRAMRFIIAGSGSELPALQKLARHLSVDNIKFAGFVANTGDLLASLQVYVQPSRNEGLCLAAHEAMQAGLPVIATPVGQLTYSIVDGETGLLCGVGDVEAFAVAILGLFRDPARAQRMGMLGRQRVLERFGHAHFEACGRALLARVESEVSYAPAPRPHQHRTGASAVPLIAAETPRSHPLRVPP